MSFRRVSYAVALVAAFVLATVPAVGDPGEPTAPLTSVALILGNYATAVDLACDTPVTTGMEWDDLVASDADRFEEAKMRIEAFVKVAAFPSEHWRTRLHVDKVVRGNNGLVRFQPWDYYDWRHQNVPPSGRQNWELTQSSHQFLGDLGWWRVWIDVTGDESGNQFTPSCVFEVIAPPAG